MTTYYRDRGKNESVTQYVAATLAHRHHYRQMRKYTQTVPYFNHCRDVAERVRRAGGSDSMIAAAYLHDVLEDTDCELSEIVEACGTRVAQLVVVLTDPPTVPWGPNRAARKAATKLRFAAASPAAKTIKLADLIDNAPSIIEHDPKFAKVFLAEMRDLLEVLIEGDFDLWMKASEICNREEV